MRQYFIDTLYNMISQIENEILTDVAETKML